MYLTEDNINQNPFKQFDIWFEEAKKIGLKDPNAMNVASSSKDGIPSSRMVLLKRIGQDGFVFFTDYDGNKGKQIIESPYVALNFWWAKTNKQIRIEGKCSKASEEENNEYFSSRPRGSQISASVSLQSEEIDTYESLVERSQEFELNHNGKDIMRPQRWGGFIVEPESIEFWVDQKNRLHIRELYTIQGSEWKKVLLSP